MDSLTLLNIAGNAAGVLTLAGGIGLYFKARHDAHASLKAHLRAIEREVHSDHDGGRGWTCESITSDKLIKWVNATALPAKGSTSPALTGLVEFNNLFFSEETVDAIIALNQSIAAADSTIEQLMSYQVTHALALGRASIILQELRDDWPAEVVDRRTPSKSLGPLGNRLGADDFTAVAVYVTLLYGFHVIRLGHSGDEGVVGRLAAVRRSLLKEGTIDYYRPE